MIRSSLARASALAAILIVASACSGDDSTPTTAPTATATAPSTTTEPSPATSTTLTMNDTTTDAVKTIDVAYAGGQVSGGAQRTTVRLGEKVRVLVTSDVADEVHVHTYDIRAKVAPGQPAELELVASIPGRHQVELEKKGKQLLTLEVR